MIIANKQDITAALYKIMEDGNKAVAAGKKLKLEISEFKETRSTAQNAWYWLFCSAVAKFLDDAGLTYGESATIKKPEVGDVWIYENHLYRISKIEDKEDGFGLKHKDACLCVTKDEEYVSSGWYDNDMFKKYGVYLGKSIASINDLFKVQNNT